MDLFLYGYMHDLCMYFYLICSYIYVFLLDLYVSFCSWPQFVGRTELLLLFFTFYHFIIWEITNKMIIYTNIYFFSPFLLNVSDIVVWNRHICSLKLSPGFSRFSEQRRRKYVTNVQLNQGNRLKGHLMSGSEDHMLAFISHRGTSCWAGNSCRPLSKHWLMLITQRSAGSTCTRNHCRRSSDLTQHRLHTQFVYLFIYR